MGRENRRGKIIKPETNKKYRKRMVIPEIREMKIKIKLNIHERSDVKC